MRGPVATLHHIGDEFHMSKVEQMRAAIARHGSAVPTHLDLMCGDADDCAQTGGLVVVLADPDDLVAYRQPTSHCGIHDSPPGSMGDNARERHGLFRCGAFLAARSSPIRHIKTQDQPRTVAKLKESSSVAIIPQERQGEPW